MAYVLPLVKWMQLEDSLRDRGTVYYFSQSRNDGLFYGDKNAKGPAAYHIRSVEFVKEDEIVFKALLTKSIGWRKRCETDLATLPIASWLGACSEMDSSSRQIVAVLAASFEALGAVFRCEQTSP